MRRVVVTGLGIISPFGVGVEHNWESLISSKSGIRKIKGFDASDIASQIAGEVPMAEEENAPAWAFDINKYIEIKEQKKMDKFIHFGFAAAMDAVADSGWIAETEEDKCRTGVLIGSGIGGLSNIQDTTLLTQEKGPRRISPFFIASSLINLASGQVSIKHGFKGPNHAVVTACASGSHAIGDAYRLIAFDDADVMVAGGTESAVCKIGVGGFAASKALSTKRNDDPEHASRPYDKDRDGFVIAEGAGIIVLEELEHAKARGAKIYGEIIGYGLSGDAYHVTAPAPDGNGGLRAMQAAIKRAGIKVSDIDYINTHGTSTPTGDDIELKGLKSLLGDDASKVSISSTKSSVGHLLGAAGAVEAVFCLKAMEHNIVPATLNLDNPSDEAEGLDLTPLKPKERELNIVMSNSFGFGGTNASLIFKKYRG